MGLKRFSANSSLCSCGSPSISHVASDEGHEGNEGCWCQEGRPQGHDCNSSLQLRGLQHGLEGERRKGRRGELHVGCSPAAEEKRVLQVRRRIEPEIEEEGRNGSSQRYQSFHQGAMCLQGEACVPDCEGPCTQTF